MVSFGSKNRWSRFLAVAVAALVCSVALAKKDRNAPHHHQGQLKPYTPGPFDNLKLGKKDEDHLLKGKPIMKQSMPTADSEGGGAICIQDVEAPKHAVWNQILTLNNYKGKVPKVKECKNYVCKQNKDGTSTIKTVMKLGIMPGYSYTNYYDHTFSPDHDSCVWSLDYDKTSDFDDVAGHWHLEDHPTKPGCTRVFYACDINMRGSVPGPVLNFISKSALKQATHWVKKESEALPDATPPKEYGVKLSSPAGAEEPVMASSGFGGFGKKFGLAQ